MSFSAVILAGGKSSRMGRDKAFLEIGGQTLLARQIDTARRAGASEIFISGRQDGNYLELGCAILFDHANDAGPIAGIHRALEAASHPLLLVLAVDLPDVTPCIVKEMLKISDGKSGVIPRIDGQIEPLAAFYPRTSLALCTDLMACQNYSAKKLAALCVEAGAANYLDWAAEKSRYFTNCNWPADVEAR